MTEEERRRKQAELELLQVQRRKLELQRERDDIDAAPSEMSGLDKARGAVQSVNKGSLLGFGDEIAGTYRAAIDPWVGLAAGEGAGGFDPRSYFGDFGKRRDQYIDDERKVTENFEDDYGKTAMALNVVGGIASPINRVAPGYGGSGSTAQRIVQATARGGAEGGLQGLGEGEGSLTERRESAATGAKWGAGMAGGLSTIGGGLGRAISRRREGIEDMVSEVDGERVFKPITLADNTDDRRTGRFFSEVLGGGSGGGHKLGKQEAPFLEQAADDVLNADAANAKRIAYEGEQLTKNARGERAVLATDARRAAHNIKNQQAYNQQQASVAVPETAPTARGPKFDPRAQPEVDIGLRKLAQQSLPSSQVDDVLGDITDPLEMGGALNKYYGSGGPAFREVKDITDFELPDSLRKRLSSLDPASRIELGDVALDAAKKIQKAEGWDVADLDPDEFLDAMLTGEMDGEVLMAIRNSYATASNKAGGMKGGAQRKIAQMFDEIILDRLGKNSEAGVKFLADKKAYPNYVTYTKGIGGDAADMASGRATPEELFRAGKRQAKKDPETGIKERPMGEQLRALQRTMDARKLAEAPTKPPPDPAIAAAGVTNTAAKDAAAEVAAENKLTQASANAAKKLVQASDAGDKAINLKQFQKQRAVAGPLGKAKARAHELDERATRQGRSILSKRLTDIWGGSLVVGRDRDPITKMAAGIAAASGATREGAQLAVAGQAEWQKALAKALRDGDMAKYTQILSRIAAGQATGE